MPEFNDFKDAFRWWLENEYPKLNSEDKVALKNIRNDFVNHKQAVSEKRIEAVLSEYGILEVKIKWEKS